MTETNTRTTKGHTLTATTDYTPVAQNTPSKELANQVRVMESQFQLAMPKGLEATQLVRDALTCIRQTPKLAECSQDTVLGALMTCAQLGLRPGVLGHAYLLPFWDGKTRSNKAQLVIGYQGLVELAYRSGTVLSIAARTVYTNDEFEIEYHPAGEDTFTHRPYLDGERGSPVFYYAAARLKDGGYAYTEPVTHDDMQAYMKKHATAKTKDGNVVGPWRDHFEGMAHKTMVRKLMKLLPKSTVIAQAISQDGAIRRNHKPEAIDERPDYIDGEMIDETPVSSPPAEVVYASTDQLQELSMAREQVYGKTANDNANWRAWVDETTGRTVAADKDLTRDEADDLLALLAAKDAK